MGFKTPLHDRHVSLGARMVDFGGWDMPVNYGSQIEEHHAVRRDAGMFDVSHMCVVDLKGAKVRGFLQYLLANDVGRLTAPGKALYSCMLKEDAGVIDDLIVYFLTESWFRLVVNAGTRDKDLAWIRKHADLYGVDVNERKDLAMIAVQGPKAREKAATVLAAEHRAKALALEIFFGAECGDLFVARTGYTGEDGWEIMVPATRAVEFWDALQKAGIAPAGLGARDTLRLEAGMNLYGNDMDETVSPLDAGLAWTVELKSARDFIGKTALVRDGKRRSFLGLKLLDKGVMRGHQRVVTPAGDGELTSGTFSPTLNASIGLARMPLGVKVGDEVSVDIRGKLVPAKIVKVPFVRNGQILV